MERVKINLPNSLHPSARMGNQKVSSCRHDCVDPDRGLESGEIKN